MFVVTDMEADVPARDLLYPDAEVVISPKGLPRQRNFGLDRLGDDADIVVFFDDDYLPSRYALENIAAFFAVHPDVHGVTGNVLADGIKTPGIDLDDGLRIVAEADASPLTPPFGEEPIEGLYGCNMAYRTAGIGASRFDENLPLYGWLEDVDFANTIAREGRIVKTDAFWGVHRGVKRGRQPGATLGYSQIANPVYLWRKGTISPRKAMKLMTRNMIANHAKAFAPEPYVDRMGRVKGNWKAIGDLVRGRLHPTRILDPH